MEVGIYRCMEQLYKHEAWKDGPVWEIQHPQYDEQTKRTTFTVEIRPPYTRVDFQDFFGKLPPQRTGYGNRPMDAYCSDPELGSQLQYTMWSLETAVGTEHTEHLTVQCWFKACPWHPS